MYRIGILGTENSHALAFTEIINCNESEYSDFNVVALYALEKEPSQKIVDKFPGIVICSSPEEMVDMVDCAIITARHGKYHKDFAMPFIKSGKPVFIDKPFTISLDETNELLAAAEQNHVPVIGGSGCKFAASVLEFKSEIESGTVGKIKNAVMSFPCDVNSVYGGIYFYSSHLVEMALTVFGYEPVSVKADIKNDYLTAVLRYNDFDVYLSFSQYQTAIAYGEDGYIFKETKTDDIYPKEVHYFTKMVRSGKSDVSRTELVMPVVIMNAIDESVKTGHEVSLIC